MPEANKNAEQPGPPQLGGYQIIRPLGSGGMSHVFQAIHEASGSIVALKVLPRKLAQNPVLLQRFLREAKSAENLDHPNIVAIYDRGFDQGRHYLVLEYVEGRDLSDRVRADGPLEPKVAIDFIREVAEGLNYAAKLGVIHRDVKPANLLMTPEHRAKIIDLGLAFQADEEDERVTRDGTTVGTVDYMSPEQARDSRKLNERSDIYSLGCTFYYLLTGSAPFPGGNLADKLARHHSAAVPDIRQINDGFPADLAQLIQQMMAKKPEQRFANYSELIQALNQLGQPIVSSTVEPLQDVLIDDDDDDDVVELTVTADSEPDIQPQPHRKPRAGLLPGSIPKSSDQGAAPIISLAELAALDSEAVATSRTGRRARPNVPASPESSAVIDALLEEDEESVEASNGLRRTNDELPLQTWIVAGVMVGIAIAVLVFGVRFGLSLFKNEPNAEVVVGQGAERTPDPATASIEESNRAIPAPTRPSAPPVKVPPDLSKIELGSNRANTVVPLNSISSEIFYPDAVLERLGIDQLKSLNQVDPNTASKMVVARVPVGDDPSQLSTLASALGRMADVVEIADTGPLHEDDFQMTGKSKTIRARASFRPIIKVEFTYQTVVRDQPAKFVLGLNGIEQLIIEGIDLVVDVRDLPLTQSTLFLCQGVSLILKDCTISLINAEDRKNGFSVFRMVSGPRPNVLLIQQSLVRGPIRTLVDVDDPQAKIELDRTVVLGSNSPLFIFPEANQGKRSLEFTRCLMVTRGSMLAWSGKPATVRIRSLGTTFGHVDSTTPAPWLMARNSTDSALKTCLNYDGEDNLWLGWSGLAQWGNSSPSPGSVLTGLRSNWAKADSTSRESEESWPTSVLAEQSTAADFQSLVPSLAPSLRKTANPHPFVLECTVDQFARLPAPALLNDLAAESIHDASRPTVNLSFDLEAANSGDLGQFLQDKVTDPAKRYIVQLSGVRAYPMTPIRLPDGVSLVIMGPRGSSPNQLVPVLYPAQPGLALLELHRGDLAISHVGFSNEGANRTHHWLYLDESLLALQRCRYRDTALATNLVDPAIVFQSHSSEPFRSHSGAFAAVPNLALASLKDCWISTSGIALRASLTRGVVRLENCLVQAGDVGFQLKPVTRPGIALEADLIFENCTVANDQSAVALDASAVVGNFTGRPWLVSSRFAVFPRSWRRGGALVEVAPTLFARGSLFWQSSQDLYEVSRFLKSSEGTELASSSSADLKRHWIDLWGMNHTRGDRGPDAQKTDRIITYRDKDRPKSTRPNLSQLELDPAVHKDRGVDFKALPALPRS